MKWGAARPARALIGAALLGPAVDVFVYWAAAALGSRHTVSFLAAVALVYLPQLLVRSAPAAGSGGPWGRGAHLVLVTLIAFFLRAGVFALLKGWGWPGEAAIVVTAILTAAAIIPGYAHGVAYSRWNLGGGAGWRAWALGAVTAAAALRLIYAGRVELLPEEAYYWNYARHLDFGYLDHPPMAGWLIRAGTAVFGQNEFGVRSAALCCGALGTFFAYRLTRNLFGKPAALVGAVLVQTLPFFFLAGMLMTPDAPLTAAWAGALYFLERALVAGRGRAWWGAGVCFGLGLLSKYTIGLLGLSALMFVLIDRESRRWLRRFEPYAAALIAAAIFSPAILWNARNGWASFAFQTSRRLAESPQFALPKLIASILVLLTPLGLAEAAWLLARRSPESTGPADSAGGSAASARNDRRAWRFLQATTLTPLAVFAFFSLRHEVKLDWTGAPWLAVVPALSSGIVQAGQGAASGFRAVIRAAWVPTLIVLLLVYGGGFYHLALGIPPLGYGRHPELVPVGWRDLGRQVNAIAVNVAKASGAAPLVVGMDRYAIASELAFYAPDPVEAAADTSSRHLFGEMGLMYERWFPPAVEEGRTLLLVAWDPSDLAQSRVVARVERLGPIQGGTLRRDDAVIRRYYYRLAYGYRGLPGPAGATPP